MATRRRSLAALVVLAWAPMLWEEHSPRFVPKYSVRALRSPRESAGTRCSSRKAQQTAEGRPVDSGGGLVAAAGSWVAREVELLRGSSLRRSLAALLAALLALALNAGGATETLLSVVPGGRELAKELRLDTVYAVDGLKAHYGQHYRAQYPEGWASLAPRDAAQLVQAPLNGKAAWRLDSAWSSSSNPRASLSKRQAITVDEQRLAPRPGGGPVELADVLGSPQQALQLRLNERTEMQSSDTRSSFPVQAQQVRVDGNDYYRFEWRTDYQSPFGNAGFSRRGYGALALGPVDAQGKRSLYTFSYVAPDSANSEEIGPRLLKGFRVTTVREG